jgi:hypothetical protein
VGAALLSELPLWPQAVNASSATQRKDKRFNMAGLKKGEKENLRTTT